MGDSIINKVDHGMSTTDKNRGCSRKGRKCHGLWHRRGCSCARGKEQCREEGNVGHRWQVKEVGQEEARIEQILLSGILPVMVGKGIGTVGGWRSTHQYRSFSMEEGVGFVDMWLHFVWSYDIL